MAVTVLKIGYQGVAGAFSALAAQRLAPTAILAPYATVELLFAALAAGAIDRAMTAIENRIAGTVPAVLDALPDYQFYARREHCQPIRFHAWGNPGASLSGIRLARSHSVALKQCGIFLRRHGIGADPHDDTAAAAQELAAHPDPAVIALASAAAGTLYGLQRLATDIADRPHNFTRFILFARTPGRTPGGRCVAMFHAVPHSPAHFTTRLVKCAARHLVTITRCDIHGADYHCDLDAPTAGHAAQALAMLQPALAAYQFMGQCAASDWRRRHAATPDWFRFTPP